MRKLNCSKNLLQAKKEFFYYAMKLLKFLVDADMPKSSKEVIQEFGHEVIDVRDIGLRSAPDQRIIEYAFSNGCIIVTKDLDFGDIIRYPLKKHHGVIILRLPYTFTANETNGILRQFLKSVDEEKIINAITIVELGRYRIRK